MTFEDTFDSGSHSNAAESSQMPLIAKFTHYVRQQMNSGCGVARQIFDRWLYSVAAEAPVKISELSVMFGLEGLKYHIDIWQSSW